MIHLTRAKVTRSTF